MKSKQMNYFRILKLLIFIMSCSHETPHVSDNSPTNPIQLHDFTKYNQWANEAFFDWLLTLSDSVQRGETTSSFPTVESTLIHLWGAEHGWMCALKQETWTLPYSGGQFEGDFTDLIHGFRATTAEFTNYVLQLNEEQLQMLIPGSNDTFTKAEDIILHVINHASYHRGQLVTMARSLGAINPPRTDFIYYKRQHN
jgi:uncharacterized damage-inducible protein DinB